jgi:hypothetical protein
MTPEKTWVNIDACKAALDPLNFQDNRYGGLYFSETT